jgi:uncharacterized protein with NAD-binding domain and iron-sulfur cluster
VQIAIIGGGPAGLATAFHLTEAQQRHELDPSTAIHVYEAAWRPGGKGASGRNPHMGHRIEEHGIHLFGAFYLNAFRMLRSCYEQLCGPEHGEHHLQTELLGNSVAMSRGIEDDRACRWFGVLPESPGRPWDSDADFAWDVPLLAEKLLGFVHDTFARSQVVDDRVLPGTIEAATGEHFLRHLLDATRDAIDRADDRFRPALEGAEMFTGVLRGIVADDLPTKGIDSIDDQDHIAWLRRHGVSERTLASSMVEAIPAVCFQFPRGDSTEPASMSAAAFVAVAVRQLLAPGEFNYFFRRGTGETIVLPIVLALAERGVHFHFDHRLVDATTAPDGSVASLRFETHGAVGGLDALIPVPHQHVPADHDCRLGLGRAWASEPPPTTSGPSTVELEAGRDFDAAVLAIPPATFAASCPSLSGLAPLDAALPSVATVAVQLWFEPDSSALLPTERLSGTERLAGSDWEDPCNGWTDFSDLVEVEGWEPRDRPGALVYFCGTVADSDEDPDVVAERELEALASRVGALFWGGPAAPVVDQLFVPGGGSPSREQRLDAQYARVNRDGAERYVLAGPGQLPRRPRAWESGSPNLVLAGDWTRQGFNVSSFEGAVMSGALASFAVCGSPHPDAVAGYRLLRGDPPPAGRDDLPPAGWAPVLCS